MRARPAHRDRYSLARIAEVIGARVIGDGTVEVRNLASIASAGPDDLTFVQSEDQLQKALESRAAAVIAGEFAAAATSSKPLLIAVHPRLAFARAGALLYGRERMPGGVHPSAVVAETAKVAKSVAVGANVVIEEGALIGESTQIGAGASIGAGVAIGRDCIIKSNVSIYRGTRLGDRVVVQSGAVLGSDGFGFVRDEQSGSYVKFPQIGTLDIGDDVEIGANCTIDRGALDATVIGRGSKLDNLVHIGHNVRVGEDVVIAAQTGISGSCVIGDGVVLGGQVGIGDHAEISDGVFLGGQGGVLPGKILRGKGVVFWGTPAKPLKQYLKELAVLARIAKRK